MCGLVGVAGDTSIKNKDAFKDMLLINQLRGRDSTGVFTVSSNNSVDMAKSLGTPEILMDMKSFDATMLGMPKIMAGHCRSKTIGDNTRQNAHPYEFDRLIGMHNGTLRSYYSWKEYENGKTDSYALYAKMNASSVEETLADLDPDSHYALVWWDKGAETLNFLRNEHRPLWFTWSQDRRRMYWASEPWFFGAAARKDDLWDGKPEKEGDEPRSPYWQLPINQLWSFSINDRAAKGTPVMHLHPIRELKAEGKKGGNFQYHHSYHRTTSGSTSPNTGGEVVRPFDNLNDKVDDIGKKDLPGLPRRKAITSCQVVSPTTHGTPSNSKTPSSNVSDFRPASMRGKSSSRNILSLPRKNLRTLLLESSEKLFGPSKGSTTKTQPLVSLRKVAGVFYIACKKTNSEWSEAGFEQNTKGICCFCEKPIGDLDEVAEFINMNKFICSSCHTCEEPSAIAC